MLEEYQEFDTLESSIVQAADMNAVGDESPPQEEEEDDKNEDGEGTEEDDYRSENEERVKKEEDSRLGVETELSVLESETDLGKVVEAGYRGEVQQVEQLSAGSEGILWLF